MVWGWHHKDFQRRQISQSGDKRIGFIVLQKLWAMSSFEDWNCVRLFYASVKNILAQLWYFNASREMQFYVPFMLINRELLRFFSAYHKKRFFSILILSLWSIMLILILCPLLFIFTIQISELLKIMIHNPQETSGDIFWKSCWKGGCRCSYTSGTDPERN